MFSIILYLLFAGAPRIESSLHFQYLNIRDNKGQLSIEMNAYPTPYVSNVTYQRSTSKDRADNLMIDDKLHVACVARNNTPALVTCNISVADVTYAYEGVYQVVFSNGLGIAPFNFLLRFEGSYLVSNMVLLDTLPLTHINIQETTQIFTVAHFLLAVFPSESRRSTGDNATLFLRVFFLLYLRKC